MKNIIALFVLFIGYGMSVQAATAGTKGPSDKHCDTTIVGYSIKMAATVDSARSMALSDALSQALSFIDTSFANHAQTAYLATLHEECDVKISIEIQKKEQGYEARVLCWAERTSADSMLSIPDSQGR